MSDLLTEVLLWKTECENTIPRIPNQKLSVTTTAEDVSLLRERLGIPVGPVFPGFVGKVFGVDVYVEELRDGN